MDENNPNPINEPVAAPQAPEEPVAAPAAEPPAPAAPIATPKKSNKALIIILVIVLLAIIGAGVYFLLNKPKTYPAPEQQSSSDTPEEEEKEETELADETVKSALFDKLLALHVPKSKSYLEYANNYIGGQQFEFRSDDTPSDRIYPDASELTNADKLYIVTSYLMDHGGYEPIANFDVPSDFLTSAFPDYCSNNDCNREKSIVSEEKVVETFRKFFGTDPTLENPIPACGGSLYNAEYHIFHRNLIYCGGLYNLNHQLYITKYTKKGKDAYIYASLDSIKENDENGVTTVYRAFLANADLWDSDSGQSITPDESLLHEESLNLTDYGMYITPQNYTFFEQYRFTFEQDDDGNYFFKAVEKL